jgi:hypothetical protein
MLQLSDKNKLKKLLSEKKEMIMYLQKIHSALKERINK